MQRSVVLVVEVASMAVAAVEVALVVRPEGPSQIAAAMVVAPRPHPLSSFTLAA